MLYSSRQLIKKLSIKSVTLLIPVLVLLVASCKKGGSVKDDEKPDVDVYIAGTLLNSSQDMVPGYLKNNEPVYLSTGGYNRGSASQIVVKGNDVYVIGKVYIPDQIPGHTVYRAAYWKNGVLMSLSPDNFGETGAQKISVEGNDVYILGYEADFAANPVYWKNGVAVDIKPRFRSCVDMEVAGDSILIAGELRLPYDPHLIGFGYTLKDDYYKLYPCIEVFDIEVSGKDKYVLGLDGDHKLAYWKNGVYNPINADGTRGVHPYKLLIYKNDVYACGAEFEVINGQTVTIARYWKNGLAISPDVLPAGITDNDTDAAFCSMAIVNDDIYLVGNTYKQFNDAPVFLINNKLQQVNNAMIEVKDIYVAER